MKSSSRLLEILRSTLEQVNCDPELPPDNPEVIEFKRSLVQSIGELENGPFKKAA